MASAPLLLRQLPSRLPSRISHIVRPFLPIASSTAAIVPTPPPSSASANHFSTSSNKMSTYDSKSFKDATEGRRSIYQLSNKSTISENRLKQIVTDAIKHVPSSFNSQSSRLVVLVKDEHVKFWDIVTDVLKGIVPEDQWEKTAKRMDMFRGAYGSILFYEDPQPVKDLQTKYALYADKFPTWSEHTSAMHQYYLWTALEAEGLAANLQHYNPLPNQRAAATWDIPTEWDLKAQLVFGAPAEDAAAPAEKSFEPVEKRVFFHGA